MIERGYTPFVVIRPENDASRNLYTKLGFKRAFATVRVTLVPNRDDGIKANYMNGHHLNGHNANEEIDTQKDEGIEDMRAEIPESINQNPVDVAKDEGIDDEDVWNGHRVGIEFRRIYCIVVRINAKLNPIASTI